LVSGVFKIIRLFEKGTIAQKIIDLQMIEEKKVECVVA
jgi:hypothetical protein